MVLGGEVTPSERSFEVKMCKISQPRHSTRLLSAALDVLQEILTEFVQKQIFFIIIILHKVLKIFGI